MTEVALHQNALPEMRSGRLVSLAVKSWFSIAALGHWIFCAYILAVFLPPFADRGMRALEGMHLPSGFIEGDLVGNLAAISHVLLAGVVIGGGPLQLIPAIRRRFPRFHRYLGRTYLLAAVVAGAGGLYMTWTRSPIGDVVSKVGISGDGIIILLSAFMALRFALARRIAEHRRWALRLFLASSAVWFFRVGLMAWVALTGGAGIDFETFTGPFLYLLGFAQYLLPLAMLEWYFYCQRGASERVKLAFVVTLALLTVYMSIGIFMATVGMWLPRM